MRTNHTKAKLAEGEVVFGGIVTRYAPDIIEILGLIGYDFVMIDCEHGPSDLDQVEHMVRAAEIFGITPIARIPDHADATVLRFLDRGVQGVIVPHVDTRPEAEAVTRAARYYPEGHRGVGGGRPHDYGITASRHESTSWVNAQTMVIPMIEDTEAVENLDQILTVPGVDVFHVAAGDLGQSHGQRSPHRGAQPDAPGWYPRFAPRARTLGLVAILQPTLQGVAEFIKLGANFVTVSAWGLLRIGAEDFRSRVQEELETETASG